MKTRLLFISFIFISFYGFGQGGGVAPALPNPVLEAPVLEFVGNANIQKSLTNGENIPANTGIGVIYKENLSEYFRRLHSIEISLFINIASTVDTLKTKYDTQNNVINKSDFGNSILLPSNSGQAFGFNFKGYLTKKYDAADNNGTAKTLNSDWYRGESPAPLWGFISGFTISFQGSNRNWFDTSSSTAIRVSNLSMSAGIFHEFIKRDPKLRKDYSVTLGFGFTGRWLAGDIASDDYKDFRKVFIGTDKKDFIGTEINFGMRLKNIKAEVRLPILSNNNSVPGLTGIQPNTFIGFTGGFSLKLD